MKHNIRKIFRVCFLIVCMLITTLPVPVMADPVETVIPEDAIYLSTVEDVLNLAENCRLDTWSIGKTVVLSNDIDLSGSSFNGIPTFGGTFLGQGHTISGINIVEEGSVLGFFRYIQKDAVVEQLSLVGTVQPTGSKSIVGGIAGENRGTIRNCSFEGVVSGYNQIGGLVGINEATGVIDNCSILGTVYGGHFVGGAVGENHGVVRKTVNNAEINTQSVQNSIELEDITLDSLASTEDASTATDIGGIAGTSSGVIRECTNYGVIGYQSMGYNVGGIAGSQNGYIVDCVNYADVQGRKEVGGIVGHMEPNISLDYDADSIQILASQLESLSAILGDMQSSLESGTNDISNRIDDLNDNIDRVQAAIDIISAEVQKETPDWDIITAAMNDFTDALGETMDELAVIEDIASEMMGDTTAQLDSVIAEIDSIIESMESMDENIDLSIVDISGEDTDEDVLGKVSQCINYGTISGDQNIGGVAGTLAEEMELEAYQDVEVSGEASFNAAYQTRVVVRDCKNYGTITAKKRNAGGIAGQMTMGAVLECVNLGNLDCISADYVGGIAGESHAIIRNCNSRSIISGDGYVGGIAGTAKELKDCYSFVSIVAHTEKAGAVIGFSENVSTGETQTNIVGNYYFVSGENTGAIDGIDYAEVAEQKALEEFLQLPNLDESLKTVTVYFYVEGKEHTSYTLNVGESLSMDKLPVLEVEEGSEYSWEVIPAVTEEQLGMNETKTIDYVSTERLTNILFDQVYAASFELKNTVVGTSEISEKGQSLILAVGAFSKETSMQIQKMEESSIAGKKVLAGYFVSMSNKGVSKLHFLIPEGVNTNMIKLFVKDEQGKWVERAFQTDLSYMIFEFTDTDSAFVIVSDYTGLMTNVIIVVAIVILLFVVTRILKNKKKKVARAA